MQTLPTPDADAAEHSAHLREIIQEQIIAAGGSLPFWKFMVLARLRWPRILALASSPCWAMTARRPAGARTGMKTIRRGLATPAA